MHNNHPVYALISVYCRLPAALSALVFDYHLPCSLRESYIATDGRNQLISVHESNIIYMDKTSNDLYRTGPRIPVPELITSGERLRSALGKREIYHRKLEICSITAMNQRVILEINVEVVYRRKYLVSVDYLGNICASLEINLWGGIECSTVDDVLCCANHLVDLIEGPGYTIMLTDDELRVMRKIEHAIPGSIVIDHDLTILACQYKAGRESIVRRFDMDGKEVRLQLVGLDLQNLRRITAKEGRYYLEYVAGNRPMGLMKLVVIAGKEQYTIESGYEFYLERAIGAGYIAFVPGGTHQVPESGSRHQLHGLRI